MKTLKNWWFAIVGFVLIILDQGLEVLNPYLVELGIPDKWIGFLKVLFGLYGVYKLKLQNPTQNPAKLQDRVDKL
jgi:hypothetical protein